MIKRSCNTQEVHDASIRQLIQRLPPIAPGKGVPALDDTVLEYDCKSRIVIHLQKTMPQALTMKGHPKQRRERGHLREAIDNQANAPKRNLGQMSKIMRSWKRTVSCSSVVLGTLSELNTLET